MRKRHCIGGFLIVSATALILGSCMYETPAEVNNPLPFRVVARRESGDLKTVLRTNGGTFSCEIPPDYQSCRYPDAGHVADPYGGSSADAGYHSPCTCTGNYKLEIPGGPTFVFAADRMKAGKAVGTNNGLVSARFHNQEGQAEVFITRKDSQYVGHSMDYYIGLAGGFAATFGSVKFTSGFFYSLKPEGVE